MLKQIYSQFKLGNGFRMVLNSTKTSNIDNKLMPFFTSNMHENDTSEIHTNRRIRYLHVYCTMTSVKQSPSWQGISHFYGIQWFISCSWRPTTRLHSEQVEYRIHPQSYYFTVHFNSAFPSMAKSFSNCQFLTLSIPDIMFQQNSTNFGSCVLCPAFETSGLH